MGLARVGGRVRLWTWIAASALATLPAACGDDDDGSGPGGAGKSGSSSDPDNEFGNRNPDAAQPSSRPVARDSGILPPVTGCGHLEVRNLDLLFMVDNSGSMKEEQEALRREFPKMIRVLTTGDRNADGEEDFPPIAELHLGVVSSDMGLVGINDINKCSGLGDDGVLQNMPAVLTDCQAEYPRFLQFEAGTGDPDQVAADFSCIATLGTDGCGFEQQLESTLKALWPSSDDSVTFLGDPQGMGEQGHGDVENMGFLRPSRGEDTSLLAVVLVTDEDDCSSTTTEHFTPPQYLDPNVPAEAELLMQGLNTRCHHNPQNLYAISRYVDGLRKLRPDSENLVVFGAITGVPAKLVDKGALDAVDFEDPAEVTAFYDGILAAEEMIEAVDDKGTAEPQDDQLVPACNVATGRAYPARRIVEVAKQFGKNSVVQSICQDDFGPAIDAIVVAITRAQKGACVVM
jgi:hypothetical protein